MKKITAVLLLLFIMILIASCKRKPYDLKPYSIGRNIDSAYLDTLYNDTL